MIKLLISLVFISCASSQKSLLPSEAEVTAKDFSSVKEAQNFVRNKANYLILLFEQSFDPYYGTPKWPLECLKKNKFQKARESKGNLFFISELILNDKNETGFCEGKLREVIFLQCKDEPRVYEIHCLPGKCSEIINANPCPLSK